MSKPVCFNVEDYTNHFDEDEDTLTVQLNGDDTERVEFTMSAEMAAEFALELHKLLGLGPTDDFEY